MLGQDVELCLDALDDFDWPAQMLSDLQGTGPEGEQEEHGSIGFCFVVLGRDLGGIELHSESIDLSSSATLGSQETAESIEPRFISFVFLHPLVVATVTNVSSMQKAQLMPKAPDGKPHASVSDLTTMCTYPFEVITGASLLPTWTP